MKTRLVAGAGLVLLVGGLLWYAFQLKGDVASAHAECAAGYIEFSLARRDLLEEARTAARLREQQLQRENELRIRELQQRLEAERAARAQKAQEFADLLAQVEDPETVEWLEESLPSHVLDLP